MEEIARCYFCYGSRCPLLRQKLLVAATKLFSPLKKNCAMPLSKIREDKPIPIDDFPRL